jgi:hypothetical protein
MLLADPDDNQTSSHPFLYAQALGAYHANVVYTGPRTWDFKAHHFDFLWVRWYEVLDPESSGWSASTLDSVRFLPLNDDDSFGFIDPSNVLQSCHILPAFARGRQKETEINVSRCAQDSKDYNQYYVGWYVQ